MSRLDKAIQRLKDKSKDYTYSETRHFLGHLGFIEYNKSKTSSFRVKFFRPKDKAIILLHKTHPGDIMPPAVTRSLLDILKKQGDI